MKNHYWRVTRSAGYFSILITFSSGTDDRPISFIPVLPVSWTIVLGVIIEIPFVLASTIGKDIRVGHILSEATEPSVAFAVDRKT